MKIDLMRKVDYFAGIPLCFLATLVVFLAGLLRGNGSASSKNVLFIELSEMGSAILVDPAMRKMCRATGAEPFFLIFRSNAPSLRLLGTVPKENVFTIREDNFLNLALDSLRFLFWARGRRIDTAIDLELFSRYSALLTGLSGAAKRIGFHAFNDEGLYRGEMLTHRVAYNPHLHIAKNFIALVDALTAPEPTVPYSKTVIGDDQLNVALPPASGEARERMLQRIRALAPFDPARQRLVLINPNASELLPHRRWMPERSEEHTSELQSQFHLVCRLLLEKK